MRFVFGLPGGHVLSIYDALYDTPEITHVLVRHEQTAASMAAAYAQLTGEPGVCLVTAGPGCTNLLTGIAEAYVGCLPIVVIAGRGATANAHRGAAQEVATDRIFAPVTKWSVRVDRADLIVDVLRQAFAIARSGKPGPVLVDIPRDLVDADVPRATYVPVGAPPRPAADGDRVAAAADALAGAARPLLIGGGGTVASGAFAQLRALAELLAIPCSRASPDAAASPTTIRCRPEDSGTHRNRLSKRLLAEADVVLGLGCRFEEMETNWRPGLGARHRMPVTSRSISTRPRSGAASPPRSGSSATSGSCSSSCSRSSARLAAALLPGAFVDHERTRDVVAELAQIEAEFTAARDERATADPPGSSDPRDPRDVPSRDHRGDRRRLHHPAHRRRHAVLQGLRAPVADRALELLRDGLRGRRRSRPRGSSTPTDPRSASSATGRSRW